MWKKYAGKEKERQLILYKYFLRKIIDITDEEFKKTNTMFVLMEKNKSKNPIVAHKITSGNVKIKNHLKTLNENLENLQQLEMFPKNRLNCRFCVFKNTDHCKSPNLNRW